MAAAPISASSSKEPRLLAAEAATNNNTTPPKAFADASADARTVTAQRAISTVDSAANSHCTIDAMGPKESGFSHTRKISMDGSRIILSYQLVAHQ
jgi:hypothetical protein